jgi:replicative DNA helicase
MTPVWKNTDLEGAVIGAILLRGADPEVMDVISRLPATAFSVSQYRDIYAGVCRQARGTGVIDPILLCGQMPGYEAIISATAPIAWAKSSTLVCRNTDAQCSCPGCVSGYRNRDG